MTTSILRTIAILGAVLVTTAAMCNKDSGTSAPVSDASAAAPAASAGPGLPADFPLAPGLSACKPIVTGPEVICEWHGVDQHAMYTLYHDALPKAGYTLLPGASEATTPFYLGAIGFKKGRVQGAVTVHGGDLTIQVISGQ